MRSSRPPRPLGTWALILCVFSLLLLDAEIQAFRCCFLCFIASTSGLKALHLSKSITLRCAFALLLYSLLHFLHLCAPLSLCVPAPPSAVLLVNYLLYFVSELMSDIKRRMELDSKIQKNGFLSVVLDNNYDLPVKPGLQQRDCSLKQRLWCKKMHL